MNSAFFKSLFTYPKSIEIFPKPKKYRPRIRDSRAQTIDVADLGYERARQCTPTIPRGEEDPTQTKW
jgi:hypothetical protein